MSDDSGKTEKGAPLDENEVPFSENMLRLYRQVQTARTREERQQAMMAFAGAVSQEHDPTDHSASEVYHDYIEAFDKAQLEFHQQGMRLARMATDCMDQYFVESEATLEEVLATVEKTFN